MEQALSEKRRTSTPYPEEASGDGPPLQDRRLPEMEFPAEDEIDLFSVILQLARRRRLIFYWTLGGLLAGILLAFILPVRYTATTKLMPPQQQPSVASLLSGQLNGAAMLGAAATAGLGLKSPNDIYVGLLQSRPIADSLIQRFDLMAVYKKKNMYEARKKLAARTEVSSEKSELIAISVTDSDKNRAMQMANAYTEELRNLTQRIAVTEAARRVMFYDARLKEAKEDLVLAQNSFQAVQQQKGLVVLDAQARAVIESLTALRSKIAAKQVEVETLRSFSTENNSALQIAESELASLQGQAAKLEARSQEGTTGIGLRDMPSAGLDYLRAQHELQYRQALYDTLLKQYEVARLDEAKDATVIQVAEPAVVPDRRSAPLRTIISSAGFGIGLLVGCAAAFVTWWWDRAKANPRSAAQIDTLRLALKRP